MSAGRNRLSPNGPTPPTLIGRATLVAALRTLVQDVTDGRGGSALIVGEAGIGKTTVLTAVAGIGAALGCQVLSATADELDREFPLRLVDAALRSRGLTRPRMTVAGRAGLWSPSSGDPVLAGVEAALEQLDGLTRSGPAVLLVDDLQWADDASLLVLDRVSQASLQQPLLLVGAYRTTAGRPRLAELRRSMARRSATILTVDPLAPDEALVLAAHHAGGPPGPSLRQWVESAAGNPLFIREVVDALDRHGQLRKSATAVEVAPGSPSVPVIVSLRDVIAERLVSLDERTLDALRLAAAIGPDFTPAELGEISGMVPAALLAAMRESIASGVVEEAGDRLRFRHGLIRESLYESVPAAMRSAVHLDAARTLAGAGAPAPAVAVHLLHLAGDLPPWACEWLENDGAGLVYEAPGIAIRLVRAAQLGGEAAPERSENLNVLLARARFQLGALAEAAISAERVLKRTTDPGRAAEMVWIQAYAALRATEYRAAIQALQAGRSEWQLDEVWAVRLRTLHALVLGQSGDVDGGADLASEALDAARSAGDPFAIGHALFVLAWTASVRGSSQRMVEYIDAALEALSGEPAAADLRILLLANRGLGLAALGRSEEAMESYEIARAAAERSGSARLGLITMSVGCAHFENGRWDEALRDLGAALESADAPMFQLATSHGISAFIHAHRGDAEAAGRHLAAMDGVGVPVPGYLVWSWLARAALAERRGDTADALSCLEHALDSGPIYWYVCLPDILRLGPGTRPDLVSRALGLLSEPIDADSEPLVQAGWQQARATAARDAQAVLSGAERFADVPWCHAVSLETAADLIAASDPGRARRLLGEAVARYESLGARADVDRAEARLRAHGVRLGVRGGRRRPKTGWAALTPAEARVADLVAQGLTNHDIARRLFLSHRTVQSHVSRVLAKLDVPTRSGIARIATGPGRATGPDTPPAGRTGRVGSAADADDHVT